MKKAVYLLMTAVTIFSFAACQKEKTSEYGDVVNNNNTTNSVMKLTGDQLNLIPSVFRDPFQPDGVDLIISASTGNLYNCKNNILLSDDSFTDAGMAIDYVGVAAPGGCTAGQKKATRRSRFNFATFRAPFTKTYPLKIKLDGVVYSGSVTRNGESFTFNWPYTTGVVISPLTVQ